MTLGLLGVALVCALSSAHPLRSFATDPGNGILQVQDQSYCDRFDSYLSYDMANLAYFFNMHTGWDTDVEEYFYDPLDYPYIEDTQSGQDQYRHARAFMWCNANSAPTVNATTGRYTFPAESSYIYGYYEYDSDFIQYLTLIAGGGSSTNIYNTDFMQGKYFVDRFLWSIMVNNDGNFSTYSIQPRDWSVGYYGGSTNVWFVKIPLSNFLEGNSFSLSINSAPLRPGEDYVSGYDDGVNAGYSSGYDSGHTVGYTEGYNSALGEGNLFLRLFGGIADTPLLMLRSLFNFELFGINLLVVVTSLLTGLIVFHLIRKYFGGI